MRKLSLLLVILTCAFVFVTYTGTSAHAATVKYSRTVQIGLSVDCSLLPTSAKAQQIIARYKLCGRGKISKDSSISGNCGTLSLNLYNNGGGEMRTVVSVTSYWYLGPIYKFFWSGTWYNNDTESGGPMFDAVFGTGYTRTSTTYYYTDYGSVVGALTYAEDQTVLGFTCTNVDSLGASVYI